jgi:Holliday junction resolvasome RuvABC ATP-dependent DNA helicase subunit
MPHVLLTGDPGMGKTQFARWLAHARGMPFFERMAPQKVTHLPPYGVILIDEVHRQRHPETLFPVMDEGLLTFVAATTKPEKLDSAFRSRFLLTLRLRHYSLAEMQTMITTMAGSTRIAKRHLEVLAHAAGGHPRTAEKIVRTAAALESYDPAHVLKAVQITADGLTVDHFDYLKALADASKPMGMSQLATSAYLTEEDAQRAERTLVSKGYVELTASGRTLTLRGGQYVEKLKEDGIWDD